MGPLYFAQHSSYTQQSVTPRRIKEEIELGEKYQQSREHLTIAIASQTQTDVSKSRK